MLLQQQEHLAANINPVGSEFAVEQFSMAHRHYVYLHECQNISGNKPRDRK